MIYLIGGAPRCGKSTAAKLVAKEHGATPISADALEGIAYRYTPPIHIPQAFPKTVMRQATGGSNERMYSGYSTEQIVEAYRKQSQATWPAIEALTESGVAENQSYVIEGHQVHPSLIASLMEKFGGEVCGIILMRGNVEETVESLRASRNGNDWAISKTRWKKTHWDIARMIVAYGKKLRAEAKRHGIPVQTMDGHFWPNIYETAERLKA